MDVNLDFASKLRVDYPNYVFRDGAKFAFRPPRRIILGEREEHWELLALHELAHALLGHKRFKMDVERLRMEAEAWTKAKELAGRYAIEVDEVFIQEQLDTYRDWLHQKSRCPVCGLTRFQTPDSRYHCPRCENLG